MKRFLLFVFVIAFGVNAYAKPLERDALLEKMVEVYGGEKALQKAQNFTQEWDVTAMASGEKGTDHRKVILPSYLYVDLIYPSRSETRILKEGQGIKIMNKTSKYIAQGPMLDAMKLQLMRLYNPLVLQRQAESIRLSNRENHYVLSLAQKSIVTDYYIDPKTFTISKVVGTLSMGGRSMSFLTRYDNYKMVDGVLMPHHEVKYAGDVNTAVLDLKSVHFSPAEATQETSGSLSI